MMKNFVSILLFAAAFSTTLFITSCSDDLTDGSSGDFTENFVDQSVQAVQAEANAGRCGCFEFVFPISIIFPDGIHAKVADYETMRAELRAWFEENGEGLARPGKGPGGRDSIDFSQLPTLDFPVEVITRDGETVSIDNRQELFQLKRRCRRAFIRHHRGHRADKCFKLVFPVTIDLPDGTSEEVADRKALKAALRAWKQANPDSDERPMLQFSITVELQDGTTQEVGSKEDLQALKEACADDN
jgi:hypothetical protein